MHQYVKGSIGVLAVAVLSGDALAQTDANDLTPRVGNIYIIGNDRTREDVIRRQLRIYPGQILNYPEVRISEKNLERLGIFATGPEKGQKPTIEVLPQNDPNNPFHDVLVHVQETDTSTFKLIRDRNRQGKPVMKVVWEERNFDPSNWPTSVDDLMSGGSFKGGGMLVRVKLFEVEIDESKDKRRSK
jgi:outer membrane protein assembly factor BamA